jgi:agmatine deiminase
MKKIYIFSFLILLMAVLFACNSGNDSGPYYHPADFDPSASTCFIWTTDFYEIIPELAAAISKKDKVTLFIGENEDTKEIEQVLGKYGSNMKNIRFEKLKSKPQNAWLRDFGPVYLVNDHGHKKLVNFFYYGKRQSFNDQIAEKWKLPVIQSSLSSTGGAREVNGKGTIILCEVHELAENRSKTIQEIEQEIKKNLGITNVIWVKRGIPQDDSESGGPLYGKVWPDGVNGHVDEFVRFADANTILISSVTQEEANSHPILAEAKERMDENYEILLNARDQDGNKFNVVKVPFAPLVIDRSPGDKSKLVASVTSYMNFIVTNSLVILPSYTSLFNDSRKEDYLARESEVEQIFKQAFPSREIVKIQAASLNRFSGGFHCVSINEPLVRK